MTRPEIIRADSIDLQDQNAPSAKDHSRQPTQPSPLGSGPPAPHQAGALREVAAEAAEESARSPRVSKEWTNGELQQSQHYDDEEELAARVSVKLSGQSRQQQDNLAVAQNGGLSGAAGEDADMADGEGDDDMDDDMLDKISSSPSIDDGGYSFPHVWPQRLDSISQSLVSPSSSQAWYESLSPSAHFLTQALLIPTSQDLIRHQANEHNHHHMGEYPSESNDGDMNYDDRFGKILNQEPVRRVSTAQVDQFFDTSVEGYDQYYDLDFQAEQSFASNGPLYGDSERQHPVDDSYQELETAQALEDDASMMIPYESSEEDDDYEIPYSADSRFIDSGWGGECLQELEDIDFEFVYALHTFVATVEGQANAIKGDTMVLLDDSNSYWWLVRVVKDSSIGYLPAEHIETPTERLARLNKHRNIDLTSTMLGDQAEKSKNPIKKAIRRRNAKTVTFAAPTYVEASDVDYSTEEEDNDEMFYGQNAQQAQTSAQQDQKGDEDEVKTVEPLKPRAELREVKTDPAETEANRADGSLNSSETTRSSDEIFEGKVESKSRNGTLRNTDSFFKDDTVETRKITLTPNLLRDDSSTSTRTSNDSKELRQRPSLDRLEKDSAADKSKDKKDRKEKKDKEKKPGMLSGLFKRKEKKSKVIDDEIEEILAGKQSNEAARASPAPSKDSEDIVNTEDPQAAASTPEAQKQPGKLQKQPRPEISPARKTSQSREQKAMEPQQAPVPDRVPPADSAQAPSMRLVQPDNGREAPVLQQRTMSPETIRGPTPTQTPQKEQKTGGTISKILRSASSGGSDPRPVKATKAKERVELDDFDTTPEDSPDEETASASKQAQRPIPGSFPDSYTSTPSNERSNPVDERLSESPVHISPIAPTQSYPPPLMVDTSSQEEPPSPVSSASPELIDREDVGEKKGGSSTTSTTWSDSQLRTFFDDDGDIKDLLVVVYDKSGVVPAGPDHPITGNMFKEENAKLADITQRLDGMLGDWLARKMRTQSSR